MKQHRDDRALNAVLRVRQAREREAQLGMADAVGVERQLRDAADDLRGSLERAERPTAHPGSLFSVLQYTLHANGLQISQADSEVRSAAAVTAQARATLAAANMSTRMVEMLLERRAAERRAEAQRQENRDLDEIASMRWARDRQGGER